MEAKVIADSNFLVDLLRRSNGAVNLAEQTLRVYMETENEAFWSSSRKVLST